MSKHPPPPGPGKKKSAPPANRVAEARFVAAGHKISDLPEGTVAEVAFAGRSNVGKSSLLNSIMERRSLVRTSKTPGATRTLNIFEARLVTGETVSLADLPGYGYANRAKSERASWGPMLEGYLRDRAQLRALVILVDVRRGANDDDRALAEFAMSLERPLPLIVCATKIDKISRGKQGGEVRKVARGLGLGDSLAIGYSAITHVGRDRLWRAILARTSDHGDEQDEALDEQGEALGEVADESSTPGAFMADLDNDDEAVEEPESDADE